MISILIVTLANFIVIVTPYNATPSDLDINFSLMTVMSWIWDNHWVYNIKGYIHRFENSPTGLRELIIVFAYLAQFLAKYTLLVFVTAVVIEGITLFNYRLQTIQSIQ